MLYVLGPLCKNGHNHRDTGQSLRYASTRQCIECMNERRQTYGKQYYDENRLRLRANARTDYHANRDARLEQMQAYQGTEGFRLSHKKYREANKEAVYRKTRLWKSTPHGRAICRIHDAKRRAAEKQARTIPYSAVDIKARFAQFDNLCAYCPADAVAIDHVVALNSGGLDCLSNLVPVCKPCNSSKRDRDAFEWFSQRPYFSQKRWLKILSIDEV